MSATNQPHSNIPESSPIEGLKDEKSIESHRRLAEEVCKTVDSTTGGGVNAGSACTSPCKITTKHPWCRVGKAWGYCETGKPECLTVTARLTRLEKDTAEDMVHTAENTKDIATLKETLATASSINAPTRSCSSYRRIGDGFCGGYYNRAYSDVGEDASESLGACHAWCKGPQVQQLQLYDA